jgi:hypothetical protein
MTARRPYGWRPGSSPGWLLRSRNPRIAYVYGISHHDPASWWTTVVVQSIPLGSGGCLRSDICVRSARERCVPIRGDVGSNPGEHALRQWVTHVSLRRCMRRIPGGNLLAPTPQGGGLLDLVQTRERCVPMGWGRFGVEPESDQR